MKQTYPDSFGGEIVGKDIASVNGNTVILTNANRATVDSDVADRIKSDLIRAQHVPYGEQFTARKLLVAGSNDEQIEKASTGGTYNTWKFADGSFIEWRQFGHHQAFAPNGHNITPRND